jgi:parvulin-like peptidyl-prolyl isomerase
MIKQLRKASEHLYTRIFIGLIVVAFIGWGISDFKNHYSNNDVVQFKYLPNIGLEEFTLRKRENLIRSYSQNENRAIDSKEDDLKITNLTLNQLINERLIDKLIKDYELEISDKDFIQHIKKIKIFHNDKGVFDKSIFDRVIASSNMSSEEFIDSYKKNLLQNLILNSYNSAIYVPNILENYIVNYMFDTRMVDIAYIDLTSAKYTQPINYTEKNLQDFYLQNQKLFELPESRNIKYLQVSYDELVNNNQVTELDINTYYNDNKSNFENQTLQEASKEIESILQSSSRSRQISDVIKKLEDQIASGQTLRQISEQNKLKINSINNFSKDYHSGLYYLNDLKDTILGMQEQEISYPIELKDGIIIFEVEEIKKSQVPKFNDIYKEVEAKWINSAYKKQNLDIMEKLKKTANHKNFITEAKKIGLNLQENIVFTRNGVPTHLNVPEEILNEIFKSSKGDTTNIIIKNDKAYICLLKDVYIGKGDKKDIEKIQDNFSLSFKQSLIEDLISSIRLDNNIKINQKMLMPNEHSSNEGR